MNRTYTFTTEQLSSLLMAAVDMFLEFRHVHGKEQDAARFAATSEMMDGLDAENELVEAGELPAPTLYTQANGEPEAEIVRLRAELDKARPKIEYYDLMHAPAYDDVEELYEEE